MRNLLRLNRLVIKSCFCFLNCLFLIPRITVRYIVFKLSFILPIKTKLMVLFDCSQCPPSYDAVGFFIAAELRRRKEKCDTISVIFRYSPEVKHAIYDGTVVDDDWYLWRFNNIVLQVMNLFPQVSSYRVFRTKWQMDIRLLGIWPIFPYHPISLKRIPYNDFHRQIFSELPFVSEPCGITVPIAAKRYVNDWVDHHVKDKKLITVTLRNSPFCPKRNSKIQEWARFAKSIDQDSYYLVFIMDTDTVMKGYPEELRGFPFFDPACWNLSIRAAIYEEAYLNLFTSGGPFTLCVYNYVSRFIYFKVVVRDEPTASEAIAKSLGFEKNQNMPWVTPYQKVVWDDDDFPVIAREFIAMCAEIEKDKGTRSIENLSNESTSRTLSTR